MSLLTRVVSTGKSVGRSYVHVLQILILIHNIIHRDLKLAFNLFVYDEMVRKHHTLIKSMIK